MKYDYIGAVFGPRGLNKDMTIDELISIIARSSRFTADEIKECLLSVINALVRDEEDD